MSTIKVADIPPDAKLLLPRRYQEEIFRQSQEGNVIAALDTGSGKTFISTLLIKWMSLQEHAQGKAIIFLVPKVTLVEQQGDFIAAQTPLRVKKLRGSVEMELTDRAKWREAFRSADVLVMTAQIFTNILTHSHWSIEKVSLIVFDECHHCRKNHAYNAIMEEYHQIPQPFRPKIFGMTASPIWNPKDPEGSLATLEKNLDAVAISVKENLVELMKNSPRPVEIIRKFPRSPEIYNYLSVSLRNCLFVFESSLHLNSPFVDVPWEKIRTRYYMTLQSLGPYSADLYLYSDMKQRINTFIASLKPQDLVIHDLNEYTVDLPKDVMIVNNILSEYETFFSDQSGDVPIPVPLAWCSPKVQVLVGILRDCALQSFQGIVFVEQRQVASCLAKMLSQIPELQGLIRCAELVGHGGANAGSVQARGMGLARQSDIVQLFRDKHINLIVATSVAEEGLDFPACDIVIRFDPLNHMVGYVQSRGRARNKTSRFVVMIEDGNTEDFERYKAFINTEPELRKVYANRKRKMPTMEEEDGEEGVSPDDLASRERYIVPSTGAILTYNTSINLLNYLCSLIPHDNFTAVPAPRFSGEFVATVDLPVSLPLPREKLVYIGPEKLSKKEAKRAAAFVAVKALHALDVFDDFLLPASTAKGKVSEDADGKILPNPDSVPETLSVSVRDPWAMGPTLWLHVISVDGNPMAGLITGTSLPTADIDWEDYHIQVNGTYQVIFEWAEEYVQRRMLSDYTRHCIWYCNTGRPVENPLSCFMVPITAQNQPDWPTIEAFATNPHGSFDWSSIGEKDYDHLLVMNSNEFGRSLILHNIRSDLTPLSAPPPGSREAEKGRTTYQEFFIQKWTRKNRVAEVPSDGPLIEVTILQRQSLSQYVRKGHPPPDTKGWEQPGPGPIFLTARNCCRWVNLPESMYQLYHIFPRILHRITDIYRARQAILELGLPPVADDWMVEATTLPTTDAGFSNQRLETLGDAVLKLAVTVHVFNKYPYRHEGQLSALRQASISNRALLSRAKQIHLEDFLTSETQSVHAWRYVNPADHDPDDLPVKRRVSRQFPRRSLQDCMEATLGAAFMTGDIDFSLRAGDALGLSFGGSQPWSIRYSRPPYQTPVPPLLLDLQGRIGYEFHRGELLVEAMTHPSFCANDSPSYQRLEFLGDAIIDLVVMRYLFDKFKTANSGGLSWARSRAVCAPALASIAIKRLEMHKTILINNVGLSSAINRYVSIVKDLSFRDIIDKGWKHEPPKAISDVVESLIGAVLVDSGYNYDLTAAITEVMLEDLLCLLTPTLPKDPISELMIWTSCAGCRRIAFQKAQTNKDGMKMDSVAILVHNKLVAGPISAPNLSLAKGLASERARAVLEDPKSDLSLKRLCDCTKNTEVDPSHATDVAGVETGKKGKVDPQPTDETEEGFARLADQARKEFQGTIPTSPSRNLAEDDTDELAVEQMLLLSSEDWEMA